jgi:hypothetical protein
MRTRDRKFSSNPNNKWDGGIEYEGPNEHQRDNDQSSFDPSDLPLSASWEHDTMTWLDTIAFVKRDETIPSKARRL